VTHTKLLLAAILIVQPGLVFAEQSTHEPTHESTHKKVQAALDWELPVNDCVKPQKPGSGIAIVDGEGTTRSFEMDSYELGRYQRKEKRWKSCVAKYKKKLMKDFEELRNCAQYGLTQAQANSILGKMALIQSVDVSSEGIIEPAKDITESRE